METVAFNTIGFHTAQILNRLRNELAIAKASGEEQRPGQQPESTPKSEGKNEPDEHRDYIQAGLDRIAEFERRASGGKKGRR